MNDFVEIDGATPLCDISGLKVKIPNISRRQLHEVEAENVVAAAHKYLVRPGYAEKADFDVPWACKLHREMFARVWRWAGCYRETQTNIGSAPQLIQQDLLILFNDLRAWKDEDISLLEQAIYLHHRAVKIHPFLNGNGRWARMISNIWLKKNKVSIVHWPDDIEELTKIRGEYIKALQLADDMDYGPLIALHERYQGGGKEC